MKKLALVLAALLGVSSAQAAYVSFTEQVSAEVMIRQVVSKKLVQRDGILKTYINRQVKSPYTDIFIIHFQCDQTLANEDICNIDINDATDDGTESTNRLEVKIKDGEVYSANFFVIAG